MPLADAPCCLPPSCPIPTDFTNALVDKTQQMVRPPGKPPPMRSIKAAPCGALDSTRHHPLSLPANSCTQRPVTAALPACPAPGAVQVRRRRQPRDRHLHPQVPGLRQLPPLQGLLPQQPGGPAGATRCQPLLAASPQPAALSGDAAGVGLWELLCSRAAVCVCRLCCSPMPGPFPCCRCPRRRRMPSTPACLSTASEVPPALHVKAKGGQLQREGTTLPGSACPSSGHSIPCHAAPRHPPCHSKYDACSPASSRPALFPRLLTFLSTRAGRTAALLHLCPPPLAMPALALGHPFAPVLWFQSFRCGSA